MGVVVVIPVAAVLGRAERHRLVQRHRGEAAGAKRHGLGRCVAESDLAERREQIAVLGDGGGHDRHAAPSRKRNVGIAAGRGGEGHVPGCDGEVHLGDRVDALGFQRKVGQGVDAAKELERVGVGDVLGICLEKMRRAEPDVTRTVQLDRRVARKNRTFDVNRAGVDGEGAGAGRGGCAALAVGRQQNIGRGDIDRAPRRVGDDGLGAQIKSLEPPLTLSRYFPPS